MRQRGAFGEWAAGAAGLRTALVATWYSHCDSVAGRFLELVRTGGEAG